jgi:hypothetical protein
MANENIPDTSRASRDLGYRSVLRWGGFGMFSNASDPLLNILMAVVNFCFGGDRSGSIFNRRR